MKVLLLNKYTNGGGAAIACKRLQSALLEQGVDTKILAHVGTSNKTTFIKSKGKLSSLIERFRFYLEKVIFMLFEKNKANRFSFSTAWFGIPLHKSKLVKEADILHIHWTNHSFLSLNQLKKVLSLNKPVFITMHDMWYFTGGCHYADDCTKYTDKCFECPKLAKNIPFDLATKIQKHKRKVFSNNENLYFIGCSKWISNLANKSILSSHNVQAIPNPINTKQFYKYDSAKAKAHFKLNNTKQTILFSAAKVTDLRKGFKYLQEMLDLARERNLLGNVEILIMGAYNQDISLPFPTQFTGFLNKTEEIAQCYSACDIYITPTLEDNLPNTVIEAMACGLPVVGFNVGGVPEIIDHKKTGYVADYKNTEDLLNGVLWTLENKNKCAENSRIKVETNYSNEVVAPQFIAAYKKSLGKN